MDISCAFATSLDTPEHIVLAERLGYRRAWCYDSPALYPDVWMTLARAAERTTSIGLGPGVLVPSLRHPITNAAAIATLEHLAPGRVIVAVGAGFTGRMALGRRALPWREVATYVRVLRAVLRGEQVEWDGSVVQMLHLPGFAPVRPIDVPLLIAAEGPKGFAVAKELADGIVTSARGTGMAWVVRLTNGTVLDDDEAPGSERAMSAAGHAAALAYHRSYERGGIESLPGGSEWRRRIEAVPFRTRHLAIHTGHLVTPNDIDRPLITGELLERLDLAMSVDDWRARIVRFEQDGVTELAYQPAGPDIARELTAFATMAGLSR